MSHRFGGEWTERKLDVLAKYLAAYTSALKRQPFRKTFIDAFAGTGYREARADPRAGETSQGLLLPDLAGPEPQGFLDGSARRALQVEPPFDRYVFVERSPARCRVLEGLKNAFPDRGDRIEVIRSEANQALRLLCGSDWKAERAVLFLDPYGMQVEWETVAAVAATRVIDLWLLFPLGIGVNRLLTRSADIPESWRRRLDILLGTRDWYDAFYRVEPRPTLFGTDEERLVKASMDTIGRYFNERLAQVFAGVANPPGVLRNSVGSPLYLLCFAVGNPGGRDIALRIANHLLREVR